ncbi:MAG: glycosyltransferase, partial [Clostridiales bacterium]|nr:glycosyltransferase [Clostridiales bacterium]
FSEKGKVIPNGINVSLFLDEKKSEVELLKKEFSIEESCPLIVGNISRFEEKKNSLFTIKIFNKILDSVPKAVLIMGGSDGGQLEDCKRLVKGFGIEKNVRFIGKRSDVPICLKLIDIYLFPSLFEGLPIALLEAQASGCFCVASDGVSIEADRGLNSVHYISLKKDETKWASEILEKYNAWKKPKKEEIVKKFTESGFEICEAHKRLMEVYDEK